MIGLEIRTSKSGRLWPTEHYKGLIDALAQKGAKHDPAIRHPDLAKSLEDLVEERAGRFYPASRSTLALYDDSALAVVIVRRVEPGAEEILLGHVSLPQTVRWESFEFDYFGTIGNRKYEAQSKRNRQVLKTQGTGVLQTDIKQVAMSFQLDASRNNRDLDNLVDPLISFFSALLQPLDCVVAIKETPSSNGKEILRISQEPLSIKVG